VFVRGTPCDVVSSPLSIAGTFDVRGTGIGRPGRPSTASATLAAAFVAAAVRAALRFFAGAAPFAGVVPLAFLPDGGVAAFFAAFFAGDDAAVFFAAIRGLLSALSLPSATDGDPVPALRRPQPSGTAQLVISVRPLAAH
jgi:hypothetical protein